ncbi:MAG: iron-containing alcohol dehydrogenase [Thalassotalea sp.]|nr:iron-containing alcohol dehydrogenase [Thalassotalea sp.]
MSAFKIENFSSYVTDKDGNTVDIFDDAALCIDEPGIYTLEGENQSGKSIFVKSVMQVNPNWFHATENKDNYHTLKISNGNERAKRVSFKCISDAYKNGVGAVFQDDDLIPTMTIKEQIILRHCQPKLNNYLSLIGSAFLRLIISSGKIKFLSKLVRLDKVSTYIEKLESRVSDFCNPEQLLKKAESILSTYDKQYLNILDKYPTQLSGGAKAVAKLLSVQLQENIEIVFLDEPFNGVQSNAWPKIIEVLRCWVKSNNKTLVVITHSKDEIIRWQPKRRYEIKEKKIIAKRPCNYQELVSAIPDWIDLYPVYTAPFTDHDWLEYLKLQKAVLIIDEKLKDTQATSNLLTFLDSKQVSSNVIYKKGGEEVKSWDEYRQIIEKLLDIMPRPDSVIIIVGGGSILNFGGVVASTVHRGEAPSILVPTTVLSIADVAVGSKTSINVSKNNDHRKHFVGTYANPSAVLLDPLFLEKLPEFELISGLSECLKHGLLQDENLYRDVVDALSTRNLNSEEAFELAHRTMILKSLILNVDPKEKNLGRVLLYGHLHAHVLERIANFSIPHSVSVWWGILIDLLLGGHEDIYSEIVDALSRHRWFGDTITNQISTVEESTFKTAYCLDTKPIHYNDEVNSEGFHFLDFESIGIYGDNSSEVKVKSTDWARLYSIIHRVLNDKGMQKSANIKEA